MKLTRKQLEAATKARRSWGAFYLLGPDDELPYLVKVDQRMSLARHQARSTTQAEPMVTTSMEYRRMFADLKKEIGDE